MGEFDKVDPELLNAMKEFSANFQQASQRMADAIARAFMLPGHWWDVPRYHPNCRCEPVPSVKETIIDVTAVLVEDEPKQLTEGTKDDQLAR